MFNIGISGAWGRVGEGREGRKEQGGSGDIMFKFNFNVRINLHSYRCVYYCFGTEC